MSLCLKRLSRVATFINYIKTNEELTMKPRVFLGSDGRPYMVKEIEDQIWTHYLHPDDKWVTLKRIDRASAVLLHDNLSEFEQSTYPKVDV